MRKIRWLLAAVLAVLLAGCSLARPEAEGAREDRFAGFYVVREDWENEGAGFHDNPNLTAYGSTTLAAGDHGRLEIPDYVLFAREEDGEYVFPGLEEGYSLFLVRKMEDYGPSSQLFSNMAPSEEGWHTTVTDNGTSDSFGGTIYCGAPLGAEDWSQWDTGQYWRAYRVYQTEDGRIYLNGEGNGFGGNGGFSYTESQDRTVTENGRSLTDHLEVSVGMEVVPRLERLVATQFDGQNAVLRSDDLALGEELPEVRCEAEAAWVLVEEVSAEGTVRTAYNVPAPGEDPILHQVVVLDAEGLGHLADLAIHPCS